MYKYRGCHLHVMLIVAIGATVPLARGDEPGRKVKGGMRVALEPMRGADTPFSPKSVGAELQKHYVEGWPGVPPFEKAVKQLRDADAKKRQQAAAWLKEVLAQTLKDEKSSPLPWAKSAWWADSSGHPTRWLREEIVEALAKSSVSEETLLVLRWFLDEEELPELQVAAAGALTGAPKTSAGSIRAELATRPHRNLRVIAAVLEQMAEAGEKLPAELLLSYCRHHRTSIRTPALRINGQQKGADPGRFTPAHAMRSPAIAPLMKEVGKLLIELPPADAPFVVVTHLLVSEDRSKQIVSAERRGWLLREDGETIEIFTPFGWQESFQKGAKKVEGKYGKVGEKTRRGKPTGIHGEPSSWNGETWEKWTVARERIEDEVAWVEGIRKEGQPDYEFLERGGRYIGQKADRLASLYEAFLAQRLLAAGKDELAARVLLPALDTLNRDEELLQVVRREMGRVYGFKMLTAFIGDRDYERAEKYAKILVKDFAEAELHAIAVRLAAELPKRRDDFNKLRLPTSDEWNALQKKLSRAEQIDYLCQRMRLVTLFQMGQPGAWVFWDAEQTVEAPGMSRDAAWSGKVRGKKWTWVISPIKELCGPVLWPEGEPRPRGMELTLKDVPQLSKYLREDWAIHLVTFRRDFLPDRTLHGTRAQFAKIINALAHKDLCEIGRWEKLTPAQIDREIERINRWAADNAGKSTIELEWNSVEESVAAGETWQRIAERVERLIAQKQVKAYGFVERYLVADTTTAKDKAHLLAIYLRHDATRARSLAPMLLGHEDEVVRFRAALLVFMTGDKTESRQALGRALESMAMNEWFPVAVDSLLKDGLVESRRQVAKLFSNDKMKRVDFSDEEARGKMFRRCLDAGMTEPYRFYLPLLDEKGHLRSPTIGESCAREIILHFAPDDAAVREIARKHEAMAQQIAPLKEWLRTKIAGKPKGE